MIRRPPISTRTATLVPYTTLFRSGNVVVGGEVDHRGNAVAVSGANLVERNSDRFIRLDVDVDRRGGWWWVGWPRPVEADDRVALAEPGDQGRSDETARTRDEDDLRSTFVAPRPPAFALSHKFCHPSPPRPLPDRHTPTNPTPK